MKSYGLPYHSEDKIHQFTLVGKLSEIIVASTVSAKPGVVTPYHSSILSIRVFKEAFCFYYCSAGGDNQSHLRSASKVALSSGWNATIDFRELRTTQVASCSCSHPGDVGNQPHQRSSFFDRTSYQANLPHDPVYVFANFCPSKILVLTSFAIIS